MVSVSSGVHDPANKTGLPDPSIGFPASGDAAAWENIIARSEPFPGDTDRTNGSRRYSRSKLLNILFTNQLARVLSGAVPDGVDTNVAKASLEAPSNKSCGLPDASTIMTTSYSPGLMLDTGFAAGVAGKVAGYVLWALMPILWYTPVGRNMRYASESGKDLARLAVDPEFAGTTATYMNGTMPKLSSEFSRELESVVSRQVELWDRSMVWAKVTEEDLGNGS